MGETDVSRWEFGTFELDVRGGELRKHGIKLKLQDKPFAILSLLLENAGDLVTHQQLRQRLWRSELSR